MDRQTDGCHEGQSDPISYDTNKAESSKVFIIMKGFDKDVGDEHLFSPKLWPNSTATGESEILYFPLPSKSLAYKPFECTYCSIES